MSEAIQKWLGAKLDWQRGGIVAAFTCACNLMLVVTPIGSILENDVARKLDFQFRTTIGATPSIDPRIKMFVIDDKTAHIIKSPDLPIGNWAWLIDELVKQKPRAIMIDKIFGLVKDREESEKFRDAILRAEAQGIKVVTGVFTSANRIEYRGVLDGSQIADSFPVEIRSKEKIKWLEPNFEFLYGADDFLSKQIKHVGHINYLGKGGFVEPFKRPTDSLFIPHWAFQAVNDRLIIDPTGFRIDGQKVPLDRAGRILVNFSDHETYHAHSRNIHWLSTIIAKGHLRQIITPGDVIVLLPHMFTGNTDFKETFIGKVQGGYIQVSLLNSVLTGNWLGQWDRPLILILLASLLGLILAVILPPVPALAAIASGAIIFALIGIGLFSYAGLVTPWVYGCTASFSTGLFVFLERMQRREDRNRRLRFTLEGMISKPKLEALLKQADQVQFEVSEQVISLMFIDIVDFSKFAEEKPPKAVFSALRHLMGEISDTVHRHGGIVDKSLGDGFLCYFGYQFDSTLKPSSRHADQAIDCAVDIQKEHLARCLQANHEIDIVHPLRIGINSAAIYIGDLGGKGRVDFTVIGHGVNYAQRFEAACDPYKIMIGPATKDLSQVFHDDEGMLAERHIAIKNQSQTFVAYEFDPFLQESNRVTEAIAIYRKALGIQRLDVRWPIVPADLIRVFTEFGEGRVVDFSASGLAVELPVYLAKGVTFSLSIETKYGEPLEFLHSSGMIALVGQIRWGRPSPNGHIHGLLIQNLNQQQKTGLLDSFRKLLRNHKNYMDESHVA